MYKKVKPTCRTEICVAKRGEEATAAAVRKSLLSNFYSDSGCGELTLFISLFIYLAAI